MMEAVEEALVGLVALEVGVTDTANMLLRSCSRI
jgi:hypothetical protein